MARGEFKDTIYEGYFDFDEGDVVKFLSKEKLLAHQEDWDWRLKYDGSFYNKQYYDTWCITEERAELYGDKVVTIRGRTTNIAGEPCYYFYSEGMFDEGMCGRHFTNLFEEIPKEDKE